MNEEAVREAHDRGSMGWEPQDKLAPARRHSSSWKEVRLIVRSRPQLPRIW